MSIPRSLIGRATQLRRKRSRRDDRATVADVRQARLDHVEHAHEIGVDGVRSRLDGLVLAHGADAGIGHHDVEPAPLLS
jgi:hypothetical protein